MRLFAADVVVRRDTQNSTDPGVVVAVSAAIGGMAGLSTLVSIIWFLLLPAAAKRRRRKHRKIEEMGRQRGLPVPGSKSKTHLAAGAPTSPPLVYDYHSGRYREFGNWDPHKRGYEHQKLTEELYSVPGQWVGELPSAAVQMGELPASSYWMSELSSVEVQRAELSSNEVSRVQELPSARGWVEQHMTAPGRREDLSISARFMSGRSPAGW